MDSHQEILQNFGSKVQFYRSELKLSLSEFAQICQLNPKYLRLIESGQVNTSFLKILKLSKALKINPNKLVEGIELK